MTEQEAKMKPCIGPAPQNTGELWNPDGSGVVRYGCAGSSCMAWDWKPRLWKLDSDGTLIPDEPSTEGRCVWGRKP